MRILPADGVTATVRENGHMELRTTGQGVRGCPPVGTAMWMALRHSDGFLDLASEALADGWGADPGTVRAAMAAWSRRLVADGLLRTAT
ncbi:PqqD family protein [Streptomyces sp. BBFR51]|uniref:PqqD family protein n=1 Tax=Streptomyces sp. BBFR51 TaxID=3372856 RepID=UPI0037DCE840